ncbi:hypothetical protein F5B19DRAFT_217182 [Rostrohypoxylon terebratum]|nr:hypothetical protein F5B19DRAFT_217182 [Rostrohypoxylon terebratum]
MRDVIDVDHQPRQIEMPLISIPTETLHPHVFDPDEEPPSPTEASHTGTSGFDVGIDTCGFTTGSTVTCDFGYDCANVGGNRGCCVAGADDCVATIYTECIDHEHVPNTDGCGQHTLCCPSSKPYCFVYAYSTESDPGATLTYVECNESQGFGKLFPFPPELMTPTSNTSASATDSPIDSPDSGSPAGESDHSSPHSSRNAGAIIGGVVGGVVFITLVIIAAFLLLRYRRQRRHEKPCASIIPLGPAKTPHSSEDTSPDTEKYQDRARAQATAVAASSNPKPSTTRSPTSPRTARHKLFRPLSAIREHPHPHSTTGGFINLATPTPSTTLGRNKSTSAATTSSSRGSFGPNWPLGPRNPLTVHPVDANLKKRLSDSRLGTMSLAEALAAGPGLGVRGLGSGLGAGMGGRGEAPRVRPLSLSRTPPPGSKPAPPKSPGVALRSPRLEFVPVSPIVGRIEEEGVGGRGVGAEPVSPIGSDDGAFEDDTQRLSYVSAPSADFDGDDLVSPVSPRHGRDGDDEEEEDEGQESLRTVSPLESRRGSVVS